jgi:hypothetical protein
MPKCGITLWSTPVDQVAQLERDLLGQRPVDPPLGLMEASGEPGTVQTGSLAPAWKETRGTPCLTVWWQ